MINGVGAWINGGPAVKTLSPASDTVAAGYYAATTLSAVDADLAVANIKSGVTIFGKAGTAISGGAVSDIARHSNDTDRTCFQLAYAKTKETKVDTTVYSVAMRIKFDLMSPDVNAAFGKIYRNGVAIGAEHTHVNDAGVYHTYSDDFDTSAWAVGDLIQVYSYGPNANNQPMHVKNFRICYDPSAAFTSQDP